MATRRENPSTSLGAMPGSSRAQVFARHHAKAKAFAAGAQPKTLTEQILFSDPAFKELVSFYQRALA